MKKIYLLNGKKFFLIFFFFENFFGKKMSQLKRELNLAFVVHETDSYDDADFQIVDIEKLEYISENLFLIKTKKFYSKCLEDGGGQ